MLYNYSYSEDMLFSDLKKQLISKPGTVKMLTYTVDVSVKAEA